MNDSPALMGMILHQDGSCHELIAAYLYEPRPTLVITSILAYCVGMYVAKPCPAQNRSGPG
jgi:hypothetical protein